MKQKVALAGGCGRGPWATMMGDGGIPSTKQDEDCLLSAPSSVLVSSPSKGFSE